jgi:serine/threonine-protein kinase
MAEGGMGEVFLAVAVGADGFEKPVVIKRLLPKFAGRADIVSLLAAEAKLMTRLTHPNIVQVIDFGRGDKSDYFVVMELVQGTNLGKFCQSYVSRGARVPIPIALYITNQVLRGLAYAHANASADGKGLVHRDISPGNILLSTFGEVKVADFGVAQVGGGEDDGWIVGKPAYVAPEQLERSAVDERADIYAVGAVLYQAITGQLHRGDVAPDAPTVSTDVSPEARAALESIASPELSQIVLRALSTERGGRHANAREMARAIEQLVETGQKIATADELAEAVSAVVAQLSTQKKTVLTLSSEDACFGSGTELTRIDGDDKHGFTLKIRETAPASAPVTTTASTGASENDDRDAVALRPPSRRWVSIGLGAFAAIVGVVALFSRGSSDASGRTETRVSAATQPSATVATKATESTPTAAVVAEPTPQPASPFDDKASGKNAGSGGVNRREAHARTKETTGKEPKETKEPRETKEPASPRESAPSASAGSTCRGQLHLYATHGWLLSGGPGSVQAPGRYDWPCGTYGLKATSRLDSSDKRAVTVTIREGTPGVVDLR